MKKQREPVVFRSNRREFGFAMSAGLVAAAVGGFIPSRCATADQDNSKLRIPLGFDNFSIRANKWNADQLIDFAIEQNLDAILLSDLDVYENHHGDYLKRLKLKAANAGLQIHAGTGSICSTSKRWNDKWGTAQQHLELGIRVANQLGSPVFRCYLGGQDDRKTPGGIQKHIETTVNVLKRVKSQAVDANVKIAVENHAGDMQAWELVGLIEAAGKEFVGATIDSGNATWTLEHPQANLETLGPYAVSSGIRDSTVWQDEMGCKVAWNAVGEGQVDWKQYIATYAKLCPGVPFQLEIISGFNKSFPYKMNDFWDLFPDAKARDFERFLEMARQGKAVPNGQANDPNYQMDQLLKSIRFCRELGLGLKS
jgi:sugar phosphate isomerase/epimerase